MDKMKMDKHSLKTSMWKRKIDIERQKKTERERNKKIHCETKRDERDKEIQRETKRYMRETKRDIERQRDKERDKETQREKERHKEIKRDKECKWDWQT